MISDSLLVLFTTVIAMLLTFIITSYERSKRHLIYRIYFLLSFSLIVWLIALIGMKFANFEHVTELYFWDSLTYVGVAFAPSLSLIISIVFVNHYEKLPYRYYLFFIIPAITNIIVWTNPLHHLHYTHFSVIASEVVFGPYLYFSGIYSYLCMFASIVIMLNFTIRSKTRLYMKQALIFALSNIIPCLISFLATFKVLNLPITATPMSFIATVILHGYSISKLNYLSISPIAMQHIVNWISDCYLILSDTKMVIGFNEPYYEVFGKRYNIKENQYLYEYTKLDNPEDRVGIYNLIASIDSSQNTKSVITYEQNIVTEKGKIYFMAEITPLFIDDAIAGFVAIFKDVTKIKESMQRLQNSQNRLMEQERLATLGQMIGGIAHNLKTPIMTIAGSANAMENLIRECEDSINDDKVTEEDYREIYVEMKQWIQRTREASSYMSDIISTVKGQTTEMNSSDNSWFTLKELFRRVDLLMRHELKIHKCQLNINNQVSNRVLIHGDINNLVQVMNNLISNAIDAQRFKEKSSIDIQSEIINNNIRVSVADYGKGVPDEIADKLFKEMVTSKGTQGTGIGLYMSNVVIRGRFDGHMWYRKGESEGSVFGFDIPCGTLAADEFMKENDYAN